MSAEKKQRRECAREGFSRLLSVLAESKDAAEIYKGLVDAEEQECTSFQLIMFIVKTVSEKAIKAQSDGKEALISDFDVLATPVESFNGIKGTPRILDVLLHWLGDDTWEKCFDLDDKDNLLKVFKGLIKPDAAVEPVRLGATELVLKTTVADDLDREEEDPYKAVMELIAELDPRDAAHEILARLCVKR